MNFECHFCENVRLSEYDFMIIVVYCFGPVYYNRSQFLDTKHKYRKSNILFHQRIILQFIIRRPFFFVRYALTIIYHALLPPSVSERELPTCLEVQGGWKLLLHVHIQWNPVSLIDLYLVEILAIWACSIFVAFSQHGEWSHSYYRTTIKQ